MPGKDDVVERDGRGETLIAERILMAYNGRPVEGAVVNEVSKETYRLL